MKTSLLQSRPMTNNGFPQHFKTLFATLLLALTFGWAQGQCNFNSGVRGIGDFSNADTSTFIQTFKPRCSGNLSSLSMGVLSIKNINGESPQYNFNLKRGNTIIYNSEGFLGASGKETYSPNVMVIDGETLTIEYSVIPLLAFGNKNVAVDLSIDTYSDGEYSRISSDGTMNMPIGRDMMFSVDIQVPACTNPIITANPSAKTGFLGNKHDLIVAATGENLSYQWQVSSNNIDFTDIGGTNVPNIDINLFEVGTKYYRCLVKSGTCESTSAVATVITLDDSQPLVFVAGASENINNKVAIPVAFYQFNNYQTLQGSINFNGTGLSQIDSIVPTSALTGIAGIMGSTANLANGTVSYSYESATAPFSFANGTQLFTVYGRLNSTAVTCGTPTAGNTPHQWGKLVEGSPVNTVPSNAYGEVCAMAGTGEIKITQIINCPNASGFSVLFDYSGSFEPSDNFVLTVDNKVLGNVSPGFYKFSVEGSLAVGNHSINISRGSVSVDSAYSVSDFASVSFTINGTDYSSGSDVLVCPGADANVTLTSANGVDWEFRNFESQGSSKTFTLSSITEGGKLHVWTYNNEGCKSAGVTGFVALVGLDKTPPTLTISKTADTLNFAQGATSGTYDISSLLTYSDNCEMAATPIVVVNLSNGNERYAPNAITILPGKNNLEVVALDKAGSKTPVSFVVYGASIPEYTLSFDKSFSTTGLDENEVIVFNLKLNSTATLNTFKTISGKINLGGFAKEVLEGSLKPKTNAASLAYTFENGILSYTITDITLAGNKTAFNFAIKPNMAAGAADELYTPTHIDAVWTTEFNRQAILTSNFEANTLIGVPVISGSFTDSEGNAIADEAQVNCVGCVETNTIPSKVSVNNGNNSYRFRALKNANISITVEDKSGKTTSTATAVNNVVNSRKHVLGQIGLDKFNLGAADVDNTNDVNTLDILQQRQNINGELSLFLNSYGVRSYYNFLTDYNNSLGKISNFNVDESDHTFNYFAIELGKVEHSGGLKNNTDSKIALSLPQTITKENARIKVPVLASTYSNIAAYQFTIDWNAQDFSLVSLNNGKHNVLYNNNDVNTGVLTLNYLSEKANDENLNKGDTLFVLEFDVLSVLSNGSNRESKIAISANKTAALATNSKADVIDLAPTTTVVVVMGPNSIKDLGNGYGIGQAVPNPFIDNTKISFVLPKAQHVTFTLYNNLGQLISETIWFSEGIHTWSIPNADQIAAGMYTIGINGDGLNQSIKVVKN